MTASSRQIAARRVLALFFIVAGVNHFLAPEIYLSMMPVWLPAKAAANLISGTAEIAGGLGLLIGALRLPFQAVFIAGLWRVGLARVNPPRSVQ